MSTEYITIKEAADRYDRAEITIRRLVRGIVEKAQSSDRDKIRPNPNEVKKLKEKRKPFSYSVSTDLLNTAYGICESVEKAQQQEEAAEAAEQSGAAYVSLLESTNTNLTGQLTVKDEQIKALNQALDDLSERQRETNVLMKGFQEQMLLGDASKKWWKFW